MDFLHFMIRLSGGAWTTMIVAATDSRISKSFPVAGAYPIFLTSNSNQEFGDFEATYPDLSVGMVE